ncbi:hypothetical protein Tsubulata_007367 [Turnera subulata]|uniref:Potassium channel tetramerisation-type BTB domain-containing protein n=1 Tax=Turnera subulata TaxID=218843 RepID=A0A9Q0FAZ6_9ROSI|nr:hypothetical protein Tsubulata_007367 [Turnera subulata]
MAISHSSEHIKLNVGGKLFQTTVSTLQSGGPDSLLSALSSRASHHYPIFIDRDPKIFSFLLSILRTKRLPSTATHFSKQELADEGLCYGIESQLLSGIDASLVSTVTPASEGFISAFTAGQTTAPSASPTTARSPSSTGTSTSPQCLGGD